MLDDISFKPKKIKGRTREILILCAFIISAALVSTLLMDLLIYPAAVFAVKKKAVFNFIVKDVFWLGLLSAFLIITARRIYGLKKEGFSISAIAKHMGIRIAAMSASLLGILAVACAVIALIYLLLNYNYYMLYKISSL